MNLKRKTALALLALGVGSAAFAGTYTHACKSVAVTIPCETSAWDVGFEVFWVEGTTSDQAYVYNTSNTNPTIKPYYSVGPDYGMGFELEASLHFGTGNDVTVSWERAHDDNHAFNTQGVTHYATFSFGQTQTGTSNNRHVGDHDYEFDAVNFEFGQHVDFGSDVDVRLHAGIQYARIDFLKTTRLDADQMTQFIFVHESDFEGVGGRVGGDGSYNISGNWNAVAHGSISLLVGDIQTFAHDNLPGNSQTGFQIRALDTVVPAAMAKSGFSYDTDAIDGHLTVEAGWRWEGYFSSLRFYSTVGANYENFTFHGPYVSVLYVS